MTTYDVGVYQSNQQHNDTGNAVKDRVVTYLENSVGNISHFINAVGKSATIPAPVEDPRKSFTTEWPCNPDYTVTYDTLLPWWADYVSCNLNNPEPDTNLLITDFAGAWGYGFGKDQCVANGNYIENLPSSYIKYSTGGKAGSMGVLMQEVGHTLISGVTDSDGDGQAEHDTCDNYSHGGVQYTSPMGVTYQSALNNYNECGQYFSKPPDEKYVHFEYDDCAGSYMS